MKLYRKYIRPMHCYPGQSYEPITEPVEKEEKWYPEEERERLEKEYGYLNEKHFSDLIFNEKYEPYALTLQSIEESQFDDDAQKFAKLLRHASDCIAYTHQMAALPDCNTCGKKDCKYKPDFGDPVRVNCPLWEKRHEDK